MNRRELFSAVVALARELPEDGVSFILVLCSLGLLRTPSGSISLHTFCRVHALDEEQVGSEAMSDLDELRARWPAMTEWGAITIEEWTRWCAATDDPQLAALRDRIVTVAQVSLRQRRTAALCQGSDTSSPETPASSPL